MKVAASLVAIALLAACTTSAPVAPPGADPLDAVGRWTLQGATDADGARIDAAFPHGEAAHAIVFDDGTLAVEGGCNRIGGRYRLDANGDLLVEPLHATKMACADAVRMAADTAVVGLLEGRAAWRIAESYPEQLFLDHQDGRRSAWVADR